MVAMLLLAALLLSACRPVVAEPAPQQADDAAIEVIDQFLEAYESYDMEKLLALHADDAVWTWLDSGKNFPDFGPDGVLIGSGKDAIQAMFENLRAGFPDWTCTVEDMLAASDKVVVRYFCSGTHTGEWNGLPPTGRPIQFQSMIMHKIEEGRVVEDWSEYDSLGWMQQMGFELAPAAVTTEKAPPVLVTGAHIHSPNGIKVGPDGNLYVASIFEQAILVLDPDTGEILNRLGAEVGVDGPDDLTFGSDGSIYYVYSQIRGW